MKDPVVENMYQVMQSELAVRLPNSLSWLLPIIATVGFLASNHLGFFDIMHHLILAQCGAERWELGWNGCQRLEMYRELKRGAEANDRTYYAMAPDGSSFRFPTQASG